VEHRAENTKTRESMSEFYTSKMAGGRSGKYINKNMVHIFSNS